VNLSFKSLGSLYELFQESDVYFMSTAVEWTSTRGGRMWTHVDRGREPKTWFSCERHKWM